MNHWFWASPEDPLLKEGIDFERHGANVFPANAGPGIEVDAEFVGMIQIARPDRVGMQFEAAQVDDPGQAGSIIDHDLFRGTARGEGQDDGAQPGGPVLGGTLLIERLAFRAVDEAFEHNGTIGDACQSARSHRQVVPHQFELGDFYLFRKIELIGVSNTDLLPVDC